MEKKTLSDITKNLHELLSKRFILSDEAESLDDAGIKELSHLDDLIDREFTDFDNKADAYAAVLRSLKDNANNCKEEIKRLQIRMASWDNQVEYVKFRMRMGMNFLGIRNHKTALNTIYLKSSESIDITIPVDKLPEKYQRTKTVIEADKIKLKEDIKAGENITGVEVKKKDSLVVK